MDVLRTYLKDYFPQYPSSGRKDELAARIRLLCQNPTLLSDELQASVKVLVAGEIAEWIQSHKLYKDGSKATARVKAKESIRKTHQKI